MARKMRDSGVEWIGEVPEGWKFLRNKWCFSCSKSIVGKASETTQLLSLTTSGVKCKGKEVIGGKLPESFDTYQEVSQNDLILCLFDMDCSAVFSGLSRFDGMISPAYKVMKCKRCIEPKYADYWFDFVGSQRFFKPYAKNIRYSLTFDEFADLMMIVPPLPEQRRIADYLDEKCAAIDGAVDELKRGIEDCKAWKKAIITEVTSVGLDDDVKLWQTELGWISNRPSYWKRNQLSSLCRRGITYGIVKLGEPCENGVKVLRCSDVKDGYLDASNVRTVTPELSDEYKRTVLSGGEVIVNVRGTLGGCAIVPKEFSGANIAREVALLDVEESKANPKFVMYTLLSSCFANYVGHEMAGAIYQGLNIATLSKYSFYAPDIKEQQAIAVYLDEKCAAIDALVAEKEKLIADLEAYKKSLIFELVTGKREVA